ncbi:MAG: PKD domain-containing protein [Candidatus Thermoplasmatota archaeon]|nr:PKD domain-containing protein [Candidatus Thermoplasmatota archaeon]
MKKKTYSYFIACILLTSACVVGSNTVHASLGSDVAELPAWSIGNFWIYDMNFDFTYSGIFSIEGSIDDLKMVVVEINETTDDYVLNITGNIDASLKIFDIFPAGSFVGRVTGLAHIDVSTLAIKDFQFYSVGTYLLMHTTVDIGMTFEPAFDFFDFPISSDDEPWSADTYGALSGNIKVGALFNHDFTAEGPFENETISYIDQEDVTVPGGSYNCFLLSGAMGPSHGGESWLWYSPEAGYLVKVSETIYGWEGVDAVMELPLKATNYNPGDRPPKNVDIHIYQVQDIDPIDYLSPPEWYYTVKLMSGTNMQYQHNYNTDDGTYNGNWISEHVWTADTTHRFQVYSRYVTVEIQLIDYDDFWEGGEDDVADISSDPIRRTFVGVYDLLNNELTGIGGATDYLEMQGPWYYTSGELPPDGSTNVDEDDALVLFSISDDYEAPEKPNRPLGPTGGKPRISYTYSTSAIDPDGDKLYYKWDWNDGTQSDWMGPYNSGVEIEASHTWDEKGVYEIKVKAKDVYDAESNWSDPLSVSIPRLRFPETSWFIRVLERFPHAFSLIRHLVGM